MSGKGEEKQKYRRRDNPRVHEHLAILYEQRQT